MSDYLDKTASLVPKVRAILCDKATESPFSGGDRVVTSGSYLCRRCGLALFRARHQFQTACGWPGFDDAIDQTVMQAPDADGLRTEILCRRCQAHLGHVFKGEKLTPKNLRHCVNTLSMDFVKDDEVKDTEEAIVAGGCFWGIDYWLRQHPGVLKTEAGYTGGHLSYPRYEDICRGDSGHYEAVRVVYDKDKTDYQQLIKRFFEIHDPTQRSGQGPDLGQQYQSVIFYYDSFQKAEAEALSRRLKKMSYDVVTRLLPVQVFWPAEEYHQDYYLKQGKLPYCHLPVSRFD